MQPEKLGLLGIGVLLAVSGLSMLSWRLAKSGGPPRWRSKGSRQLGPPMSVRSVLLAGSVLLLMGALGVTYALGLNLLPYGGPVVFLLIPILLISAWKDAS